jgi:hypothetical protein
MKVPERKKALKCETATNTYELFLPAKNASFLATKGDRFKIYLEIA